MMRKIDTIFDELIEAIERGFDISSGFYGEYNYKWEVIERTYYIKRKELN